MILIPKNIPKISWRTPSNESHRKILILTYWGRDKMAAIFQMTFSNAFSWMKMYEFRLWVQWTLFPRVQSTIFQHWFRQWLSANEPMMVILLHIYASLGLNELKHDVLIHYDDVIMTAMVSQITSLMIVYSTVYSGTYQRKHQISASLVFVRGIHRGPVNSPHKWPATRKMFPFDDVIMYNW